MRTLIALTVAFAGIAQAPAEEHREKILIQGNAAGTQTVQIDAAGAARAEYSYMTADAAITSSRLGSSTLPAFRPNTKAMATIT
jgi:hypothetical protein